MSADAQAIGRRLEEAIEDWKDGSIRRFHREVEPLCKKREVRGASYTALHRYLNGETTPSPRFLKVASEVLDVRPAWLAFGEGERTKGEDQVSIRFRSMDNAAEEQITKEAEKIRDSIGLTPTSKSVVALYEKVAREVIAAAPDADDASGSDAHVVSTLVQWLVEYPVVVLRGRHLTEVDPKETKDYLIAALHALSLLVPDRGEGEPIEELYEELGKSAILTRYDEAKEAGELPWQEE